MSENRNDLIPSYAMIVAQAGNALCPQCQSKHYRPITARWLLHGRTQVALVCASCGLGYSVIVEQKDIDRRIREVYDAPSEPPIN